MVGATVSNILRAQSARMHRDPEGDTAWALLTEGGSDIEIIYEDFSRVSVERRRVDIAAPRVGLLVISVIPVAPPSTHAVQSLAFTIQSPISIGPSCSSMTQKETQCFLDL
ncbi:hypothetical protein EYF80_043713 [Liparis tanakae]|uniref:Uncharacterized protein n=1 Tax=Liparis tanakae TaxID=230148 RepID=A0A4Z2FZ16_9TELE|nr:hypothetical protein EYF80_043713 [Liparis tanakae]